MLCQAECDVMDWLGDVLILAHRTAYSGCGAERVSSRASSTSDVEHNNRGRKAVLKEILLNCCVV